MATTRRPLRVLVADDEQLIADSLAIIFRNNGFDAISVYSGYSAMESAVSFQPDVVISDIIMPGVNGVDAVLSISQHLPASKFLLITGHADCQDSLRRAQVRGLPFLYLQKPIPPRFLVEYLKDYALQLNGAHTAIAQKAAPVGANASIDVEVR